jgi:outer membrane protein OmpA-like peptidoglycan-associated protein
VLATSFLADAAFAQLDPLVDGPTLDLQVTFDSGTANLSADAKQNLALFADTWRRVEETVGREGIGEGFHFIISAHAFSGGSPDGNLVLSEQRAVAVIDFLASMGIDPTLLVARAVGDTEPLEGLPPGDPLNERVVVTPNIAGSGQQPAPRP